MQAIVLSEYGDPNRLELRERPNPDWVRDKSMFGSPALASIRWIGSCAAAHSRTDALELPAILGQMPQVRWFAWAQACTEFKEGDHVLDPGERGIARNTSLQRPKRGRKSPKVSRREMLEALPLALLTGDQLAEATLGPSAGVGLTVLVSRRARSVGRVAAWGIRQRGARVSPGCAR